jgi:hypothetical protein
MAPPLLLLSLFTEEDEDEKRVPRLKILDLAADGMLTLSSGEMLLLLLLLLWSALDR